MRDQADRPRPQGSRIDPRQRLVGAVDRPDGACSGDHPDRVCADRHVRDHRAGARVEHRDGVRRDRDRLPARPAEREADDDDRGNQREACRDSGNDGPPPPSRLRLPGTRRCRAAGRRSKSRILAEDRLLEAPELGGRLKPELVVQDAPRLAIRVECIGLPPGAVEREHELPPEALLVRVLGHELPQLGHDVLVPPERELRLDAIGRRVETHLLQPRPRGVPRRLAFELEQRRPAPEAERLLEHPRGLGGLACAQGALAPAREVLEAVEIELVVGQDEPVAGSIPDQLGGQALERGAQLAHVRVDDRRRGRRRMVTPDRVDELPGAYRLARVEKQIGEEGALLAAAERGRIPVPDRDRPENAKRRTSRVRHLRSSLDGFSTDFRGPSHRRRMHTKTFSPVARSILCAALAGALLGAVAAWPAGSAVRAASSANAKTRCHFVRKRVHGRIRRVRVCPKPKPLPAAGTVVATIPVGGSVVGPVAGEGAVWVGLNGTAAADPVAARVDPASNSVDAHAFAPSSSFYGFAVAFGSLWISNFDADSLTRVDETTGAQVATVKLPAGTAPAGMAAADGALWVTGHHGNPTGSLLRVDPSTNAVTKRIAAGMQQSCCGPSWLAFGAGALWSAVPNLDSVVRVDPTTGTVAATIQASPACGNVAADDASVWVASGCDTLTVRRIDPATNHVVATIALPRVPAVSAGDYPQALDVTIAYGSVWVSTQGGAYGELVRINPGTNRVVGRTRLPSGGGTLAAAEGDLWVGSGTSVVRIHPR